MLLRLVSDKPWRKMCDEKYGQSNFMVGHSSIFLSLLKNDLEMLRMIMLVECDGMETMTIRMMVLNL